MRANQIPSKFTMPFGANAGPSLIRPIPASSQIGIVDGAASLNDGFPPLTATQLASGGKPPAIQDFNGIMQLMSSWNQWTAAAGLAPYDPAFSALIGGYPNYATVLSAVTAGRVWISTVDNNAVNPDGAGQTAWLPLMLSSDVLALISANAPKLSTVSPVIYVRTDGNDANTGNGNTAGTALLTIAAAYVQASKYFIPGGQVTIQLGIAGTYAAASPPSGLGTPVIISGDAANQDLYNISGSGAGTSGVFNHSSGNISYNGVKLTNTANTTSLLSVAFGASVTIFNMTFAASAGNTQPAVNCFPGGSVTVGAGIKVVSNFASLFNASNNGVITCQNGSSVTMAGGPAFSTATVAAFNGARISAGGAAWSGAASGTRYLATNGAGIDTNGAGVNYIPGSTAGVSTTGYYT